MMSFLKFLTENINKDTKFTTYYFHPDHVKKVEDGVILKEEFKHIYYNEKGEYIYKKGMHNSGNLIITNEEKVR